MHHHVQPSDEEQHNRNKAEIDPYHQNLHDLNKSGPKEKDIAALSEK